jgi:hypothetical protein
VKRVAFVCSVAVAVVSIGWLVTSRTAQAGEKPPPEPAVVEEILRVLNEKGMLTRTVQPPHRALHRLREGAQSLLPKIKFYGDLRLRGEGFGTTRIHRRRDAQQFRGRYRATRRRRRGHRLRAGAFRIASGRTIRGENTTFGFKPDWAPAGSTSIAPISS